MPARLRPLQLQDVDFWNRLQWSGKASAGQAKSSSASEWIPYQNKTKSKTKIADSKSRNGAALRPAQHRLRGIAKLEVKSCCNKLEGSNPAKTHLHRHQRISELCCTPRSNTLLIGVAGEGKNSCKLNIQYSI